MIDPLLPIVLLRSNGTFEFPAGDRSPAIDQAGDVVDGWRVLGMKPNDRLTLSIRMRAPGSGLQEFGIRERGKRRVVELCADWHPGGVLGSLVPVRPTTPIQPRWCIVPWQRLHAAQKRSTMRGQQPRSRWSRQLRGIAGTDHGNSARRRS